MSFYKLLICIAILPGHWLVELARAQSPISACDALTAVADGGVERKDVVVEGRALLAGESVILTDSVCDELSFGGQEWLAGIVIDDPEGTEQPLVDRVGRELSGCAGLSQLRLRVQGTIKRADAYNLSWQDGSSAGSAFGPRGAFPAMLDTTGNVEIKCEALIETDICQMFEDPDAYEGKLVAMKALFTQGNHGGSFWGRCETPYVSSWGRYPRVLLREYVRFTGKLKSFVIPWTGLKVGPEEEDVWRRFDQEPLILEGVFVGIMRLRGAAPRYCADPERWVVENGWIPGDFSLEGVWSGEWVTLDEDPSQAIDRFNRMYALFQCPQPQ